MVAVAMVVVVVVLIQCYCCAQRPAKAEGPIGLLPIQTAPSNCSMDVKNRFGPCHTLEHVLGDSNRLGCCFACPTASFRAWLSVASLSLRRRSSVGGHLSLLAI